jgi:hypothetical protein
LYEKAVFCGDSHPGYGGGVGGTWRICVVVVIFGIRILPGGAVF